MTIADELLLGDVFESAVLSGIIDLHFGTITATSPGLGGGCTFTVELPVMQHINGIGDDLLMQSDIIDEVDASKDRTLAARITPYVNNDDDVECADHSAHLKSLSKVLVVDDSGPSRKMLCRSDLHILIYLLIGVYVLIITNPLIQSQSDEYPRMHLLRSRRWIRLYSRVHQLYK